MDKKNEKNEKNERVMHTRIPEALDQQLKTKAEGLGVSVSNLVRNVLLHTFDLVDDIVADSANIARFSKGSGTRHAQRDAPVSPALTAPSAEPVVLGWQPLILNLNALCHRCNAILPKGTTAYLGITQHPNAASHFLCLQCIKEINHESDNSDKK